MGNGVIRGRVKQLKRPGLWGLFVDTPHLSPPFKTSVSLIELEMVQSGVQSLDHMYRLPSILGAPFLPDTFSLLNRTI